MLMQETRTERNIKTIGTVRSSELVLGDRTVSELSRQVSTPFYAYNADAVVERIAQVRAALGTETTLYYSLKANPSLGLCQVIARQRVGAEVASIGELLIAEKAGFNPIRTIFAGPAKTDEELELAVRMGIQSINAESPGELDRINRIAEGVGKVARVSLRVNPAKASKGAQMRMGGGSQQFGIDEELLGPVLDRFRICSNIQIIGLHMYTGTQMFDPDSVLEHFNHVADTASAMASRLGRSLEMVDFGGGFGVPYFEGMREFPLDAFARGYRNVVDRCKSENRLSAAQLVVELGRYLTAEAGIYVTRVVDVKQSRGKTYVVTDGGMNHHLAATGNFGQVFRKPYPMALVNRLDALPDNETCIAGPCCTPLDVFAQKIDFPTVRPGDLIGVFCSGAYGFSASSLSFLSHPTPAEVMVYRNEIHLLRERARPDQVLQGQRSLNGVL